jgi:hypothetical protein
MSGLVFADREIKDGPVDKPCSKSSSVADKKAGGDARKLWENTPDGIRFKLWENSAAGKMEAVVTSLTFRSKEKGPKWVIVRIGGEDYMMQYGAKDFQKLNSLKVGDKIIVRSRSAGRSPNHPYLVLSGDYIAGNNKVLFERKV